MAPLEGRTVAEAKAAARDLIAEGFLTEGLSATAARRGASNYQVRVVAGPTDYETALDAWYAWAADDLAPAAALARATGRHRIARSLGG